MKHHSDFIAYTLREMFFYFEYSLLSEMKRVERIRYTFCFPTPSDLMVYMDPCFWNMNVEFLWLYLSRWTVWATSYRRSTGSRTRTTKKLRYRSIYSHVRESQCCNGSVKVYVWDFWLYLFSLYSPQMMRTVTTATSVLCVCLTWEIHSSCPADICVSATPAQTRCVTRPTTVPYAGCVRSASLS